MPITHLDRLSQSSLARSFHVLAEEGNFLLPFRCLFPPFPFPSKRERKGNGERARALFPLLVPGGTPLFSMA